MLAANLVVVLTAVMIVLAGRGASNSANLNLFSTAEENRVSNPLDTLSATDIAANVAIMTEFPEAGFIVESAISESLKLDLPVVTREAVYMPQILTTGTKTKEDIVDYVAVQGDTLASLAVKFGVTSDSIRWSNDLVSTTIRVGTKLVIPPINGIVHTVKAGENAETLASKYNANQEQIVRFNDAEVSGLKAGQRIVIPGGSIRSTYSGVPYYSRFAFGNTAIYGYNGYAPGYCTWYVANKRLQIGRPVPANLGNASTWDDYAPQGWNRTPAKGAAVVTSEAGAGHVAFVEEVRSDGSVLVSEMNRRRRYEITTRVFSPGEAAGYKYIH